MNGALQQAPVLAARMNGALQQAPVLAAGVNGALQQALVLAAGKNGGKRQEMLAKGQRASARHGRRAGWQAPCRRAPPWPKR